jgi:hypothetical protein
MLIQEEKNKEIKDLNKKLERFMLIQEHKNKDLNTNIQTIGFICQTIFTINGLKYIPINIKELTIDKYYYGIGRQDKEHKWNDENTLKCFYRLEKLTLIDSNLLIYHDTLKILVLERCTFYSFDLLINLPLLEEIHFISCTYECTMIETSKNNLHKNIKKIYISGNKEIIFQLSIICKERNIELEYE